MTAITDLPTGDLPPPFLKRIIHLPPVMFRGPPILVYGHHVKEEISVVVEVQRRARCVQSDQKDSTYSEINNLTERKVRGEDETELTQRSSDAFLIIHVLVPWRHVVDGTRTPSAKRV